MAKRTALRNRHYGQYNEYKKVVNSHPAESSLDYLRFPRITLEILHYAQSLRMVNWAEGLFSSASQPVRETAEQW